MGRGGRGREGGRERERERGREGEREGERERESLVSSRPILGAVVHLKVYGCQVHSGSDLIDLHL